MEFKTSSEATNSLENFAPPMIPLAKRLFLFLTRSEWSTRRIINKLPPLTGNLWNSESNVKFTYTLPSHDINRRKAKVGVGLQLVAPL
jgi:hypothetical protein